MQMPVAYIPHGGGPWPFMERPMGRKEDWVPLRAYLESLPALLPEKPKAILVISAHWEEHVPTLMTSPRPPMLYDYGGFPPETYQIRWDAPGAPDLARQVAGLLAAAGLPTADSPTRGFDHGTFVPLKVAWPDADVPTLQLSLVRGLDPALHLAIGRALAPLREEGVFIVGSGMSYHNMRGFGSPASLAVSKTFDDWMGAAVALEPAARDAALTAWDRAPEARACHPREEHLLPLMVAAGAAGASRGEVAFRSTIMGTLVSAIHFSG